MRTPLIAFLIALGTLSPTLEASAAKATACLGTDAVAAADPAQLRAVREAVDAACPCAAFSGASGHARPDYMACAKAVVKAAADGGQLRRECRAVATYPIARSTCGFPLAKAKVACVKTSRAGKVSCSVASSTSCARGGGVACSAYDNCLDAADTNHDLEVSIGDSGSCNPLVECLNPPRPDGAACNDGTACTRNDTCSGHACSGTAYTCDAPGICQETGTCNGDGSCSFAAKPDGTTCDAGLDVRPPLTCSGGSCGACTAPGTCSVTTSRSCVVDDHCPGGETCVAGSTPAPRFVDNRDGTVTDRQSCLVWEKKGAYDGTPVACPGGASCADPHDADNRYTYSHASDGGFDGTASTDFLAALNTAIFAGHTSWRLPIARGAESPFSGPQELASIVDATAPGCGSGAPCTPAAFQTSCTATCDPTTATCSCTAPTTTWTATFHDGPTAWSVDLSSGTTSAAGTTSAGAARAVRGGLPYLDCVLQASAFQPAVDELLLACFDGCTNPLNFQACVIGCANGGISLGTLQAISADSCAADPGAGCSAYLAPLDAWCAAVPSPPPYCVEQCFDPTCESTCAAVANCAFVVQRMYDSCVAASR
jgi:hypothetical protein